MTRFAFKRLLTFSLILGLTILLGGQPAIGETQVGNPYGGALDAPDNTVFVTSAGYVGIGTTAPIWPLHVLAEDSGVAWFEAKTEHAVLFMQTNQGVDYYTGIANRPGGRFGIFTAGAAGGLEAFNILRNGNVGIGTIAPASPLHVFTPSGSVAQFESTSPDSALVLLTQEGGANQVGIANRPGGRFSIFTYGAPGGLEAFNILRNGNVGIGTTTPKWPLHVLAEDSGVAWFEAKTEHAVLVMQTNQGVDYYTGIANRPGGRFAIITRGLPGGLDALNVTRNGNVGIGTTNPQATLDVNGTTSTKVLQITGGSDLAEPFEIVSADDIQPGMVVVIDRDNPGQLRLATAAYDRTVAGVVSGAGGINPGLVMQQEGSLAAGSHPVALSGRVYVNADASNGAIVPGDLLTTSATPGHAMKVTDYDRAQGAILGKAMSKLAEGTGLVLVLVTLQ